MCSQRIRLLYPRIIGCFRRLDVIASCGDHWGPNLINTGCGGGLIALRTPAFASEPYLAILSTLCSLLTSLDQFKMQLSLRLFLVSVLASTSLASVVPTEHKLSRRSEESQMAIQRAKALHDRYHQVHHQVERRQTPGSTSDLAQDRAKRLADWYASRNAAVEKRQEPGSPAVLAVERARKLGRSQYSSGEWQESQDAAAQVVKRQEADTPASLVKKRAERLSAWYKDNTDVRNESLQAEKRASRRRRSHP